MDQVLQRPGAPHRVGRAYVYAKLLWLGWQRQSARLVVKGLALGVSAALTYVALLAVLVVTVWAGRGAWWSGPLWLLAAAAVQRAVARWADRIPDRGRLPLPVPGEGLGWWVAQGLQALLFGLAVQVLAALLVPMLSWGVSILAGVTVKVAAEPFFTVQSTAEGASLGFRWAFWMLFPLAAAASLWWRWARVKRSQVNSARKPEPRSVAPASSRHLSGRVP